MFTDLDSAGIQPEAFSIGDVPEIQLLPDAQQMIADMLRKEEHGFVRVTETTVAVQAGAEYIFFPSQWYYIAVVCRPYAEALTSYVTYMKQHGSEHGNIGDWLQNDAMHVRFTNPEDAKNFDHYLAVAKQIVFGKKHADNPEHTADILKRPIEELFDLCMQGKLASLHLCTPYLGRLIRYLVARQQIYTALEHEVRTQIPEKPQANTKVFSKIKDCAREVMDILYDIDGLERLKPFMHVNESYIKIDSSKVGGGIPEKGDFFKYLFARPEAGAYKNNEARRLFLDKIYRFHIDGVDYTSKLTTQWVDKELAPGKDGHNNLRALVQVAETYYPHVVDVKYDADEKTYRVTKLDNPAQNEMQVQENNFILADFPDTFQTPFARRYITSLLAKPFVILTGNSGTGKTRIAKQLAEYLEVRDGNGETNWELVPVGADWTDNTKMVGFHNPLAEGGKGAYVKTSIVKLIERANAHPDLPYFLILDEMNLSHVERYFSDFLSHMETPDLAFVLDGYPGEPLKYPSNLFVTGTVNIDETTYMFSPKVLDRANVVEFRPDEASVLGLFMQPVAVTKTWYAGTGGNYAKAFLTLAREIRAGKCGIDDHMEEIRDLFDGIYRITGEYGYEFAFRTVREIRQYLAAAYELDPHAFDLTRAEDEQLLQKILPKIHGNRKEISGLLEELGTYCDKYHLAGSADKITKMKGKLEKVQYASFI